MHHICKINTCFPQKYLAKIINKGIECVKVQMPADQVLHFNGLNFQIEL